MERGNYIAAARRMLDENGQVPTIRRVMGLTLLLELFDEASDAAAAAATEIGGRIVAFIENPATAS